MDTKNFKVFQRRGDQLHLGASISIGIITFNAIIIAIAAIFIHYYDICVVKSVIGLAVASSIFMVANLTCIRLIATMKVDSLIENTDTKKDNETSKNKKQISKYYNAFFWVLLNPYWKEIVSLLMSGFAFLIVINRIIIN